MLLSVTGASGAGKSTTLAALAHAFEGQPVACVEFDSMGVPAGADSAWRHGALEHWVQHAVAEQRAGRHLVLGGQVPMGELLAAPSADALNGIAVCLLHCSPEIRRVRLIGRGANPGGVHNHLAFGEWFYGHALDPAHMPHVIRVASAVDMRWKRWHGWTADDPCWSFEIIDTDVLTRDQLATRVVAWGARGPRWPPPHPGRWLGGSVSRDSRRRCLATRSSASPTVTALCTRNLSVPVAVHWWDGRPGGSRSHAEPRSRPVGNRLADAGDEVDATAPCRQAKAAAAVVRRDPGDSRTAASQLRPPRLWTRWQDRPPRS